MIHEDNPQKRLDKQSLCKSCLILSIILYIATLIIAWSNPIKGDEASIYSSTPFLYWVLGFISIVLSIFVILTINSKLFKALGFIQLFSHFISHASLYIIRDYLSFFLGSDVGSHVGWILNTIQYGFTSLHYPGMHIFSAISINVFNFGDIHTLNILSVIFPSVFLLGMMLLVNYLIPQKYQIISYIVLCMGPISLITSTIILVPYVMAAYLFPIYVFILLKIVSSTTRHIKEYFILALVFICILPVIHELLGIMIILFTLSCIVGIVLFIILPIRNTANVKKDTLRNIVYLTILSGISLLFWISMHILPTLVNTVKSHFTVSEITPELKSSLGHISNIDNFNLLDLIRLVLTSNEYVIFIILVAISFVFAPIIFHKFKQNNKTLEYSILMIFTCVSLLSMIYLLLNPSFMGYHRVSLFATIAPTLFLGIIIGDVITKLNKKRLNKIAIQCIYILIIALLVFIPHLYIYPSADISLTYPFTSTNSEVEGYGFFMDVADPKYEIYGSHYEGNIFRYSMYLYGKDLIINNNGDYLPSTENKMLRHDELNSKENEAYLLYYLPTLAYNDRSFYYQHLSDENKLTYAKFYHMSEGTDKLYDNPSVVLLYA